MTIPVLCVLVNTLQYHDTVDLVQDSEKEDPHAVWHELGRAKLGDHVVLRR